MCCIYHITSQLLTHHPTSGGTEAPQFENHNLVESYTNWQSSKQTALPKVTWQILEKLRYGMRTIVSGSIKFDRVFVCPFFPTSIPHAHSHDQLPQRKTL